MVVVTVENTGRSQGAVHGCANSANILRQEIALGNIAMRGYEIWRQQREEERETERKSEREKEGEGEGRERRGVREKEKEKLVLVKEGAVTAKRVSKTFLTARTVAPTLRSRSRIRRNGTHTCLCDRA